MDSTSIAKQGRAVHGRPAANTRHHPDRSDLIEIDQAELRGLALKAHIRKIVDSSPPLSPNTRTKLASLLRPADTA
jgi:hypothetical protein